MVKGNFEDRSKLLFKLYDIDNTDGVSFKELIKMVTCILRSFIVTQKKIWKKWLQKKTSWKLLIIISYSTSLNLRKSVMTWMWLRKLKKTRKIKKVHKGKLLSTCHQVLSLYKCKKSSKKKLQPSKTIKKYFSNL